MTADDDRDVLVLRRKPAAPSWSGVAWRLGALAGLLGLMILVHWLERDGLKDTHDGRVSFVDTVYFTMISVTTTGYGDVVPVTDRTRMFDAFVVTPIRILFLLIFVGSAYQFVARRTWERWRMKRIQEGLTDHTVVTGFGVKNTRAVEELIKLGAAADDIVVIDCDDKQLEMAKNLGCTVLKGDATRDETLKSVRIDRARLLIISAGRDDTSILICLTARHLSSDVRISIAINEPDNEVPAKRAGADIVVNPTSFAGLLLATSHGGQHIADYLGDLASNEGKVHLIERDVRDSEIGRSLRDLRDSLGLRIIRDGTAYGFWRPQAQSLEPGDIIMEIVPTAVGPAEPL